MQVTDDRRWQRVYLYHREEMAVIGSRTTLNDVEPGVSINNFSKAGSYDVFPVPAGKSIGA